LALFSNRSLLEVWLGLQIGSTLEASFSLIFDFFYVLLKRLAVSPFQLVPVKKSTGLVAINLVATQGQGHV
jgi:hypothetical protein